MISSLIDFSHQNDSSEIIITKKGINRQPILNMLIEFVVAPYKDLASVKLEH
jgi:hypothetical protein